MAGSADCGGRGWWRAVQGRGQEPCDVICFLRVSFVGLYGEERRMGGEASSGSHSQDVSMPWPQSGSVQDGKIKNPLSTLTLPAFVLQPWVSLRSHPHLRRNAFIISLCTSDRPSRLPASPVCCGSCCVSVLVMLNFCFRSRSVVW
jgi:hypothetical protein